MRGLWRLCVTVHKCLKALLWDVLLEVMTLSGIARVSSELKVLAMSLRRPKYRKTAEVWTVPGLGVA